MYNVGNEVLGTMIIEGYTRVTIVEDTINTNYYIYAFLFIIGAAGQIRRAAVLKLKKSNGNDRLNVQKFCVFSEYQFTIFANHLQEISCMEEDLTSPRNIYSSEMPLGFRECFPALEHAAYHSMRIGSPSLLAVNVILNEINFPMITKISKFSFLDGYELQWD